MTGTPPRSSRASEIALDGLTFALFAGFVIVLFLGYLALDPFIPYTALAGAFLVGSLGVLSGANWRADRQMRFPLPPTDPGS